jgi:hypothetical protein
MPADKLFRQRVFAFLLREELITHERVELLSPWRNSRFTRRPRQLRGSRPGTSVLKPSREAISARHSSPTLGLHTRRVDEVVPGSSSRQRDPV